MPEARRWMMFSSSLGVPNRPKTRAARRRVTRNHEYADPWNSSQRTPKTFKTSRMARLELGMRTSLNAVPLLGQICRGPRCHFKQEGLISINSAGSGVGVLRKARTTIRRSKLVLSTCNWAVELRSPVFLTLTHSKKICRKRKNLASKHSEY